MKGYINRGGGGGMKQFMPRYFFKLFLHGIILGLLPAMFIGCCLYIYSYKITLKNIKKSSEQAQRQIQMRVEQTMRMQDRQLFNFLTSPESIEMIEMPPPFMEYYQLIDRVRQDLGNIHIYNLGIDDSVLVNLKNDWILSISGMSLISKMSGEEHLKNILKDVKRATWLSDFSVKEDVAPSLSNRWILPNTIKFIRPYPVYGNEVSGYALISIPCSWFSKILYTDSIAEDILVLDEFGKIAFNKRGDLAGLFLYDLPYGKDLSDLLPSPFEFIRKDSDGTFPAVDTSSFISKKSKLAYSLSRSSYNNWTYIYITNIFTTWSELVILRNITLAIGLLTIFTAVFISYTRAHYFYRPVNQLYARLVKEKPPAETESPAGDEFKAINTHLETILRDRHNLEKKVADQFQMSRELLVHKLLNGELSGAVLDEKIKFYQFPPCPLSCRVVLMRIESLEDSGYDRSDRDWLNITLCGISSEQIAGLLCFPITMDGGDIVMILGMNSRGEEFKKRLVSDLENLLEVIRQNINIDAVICAGSPVENYDMISECRDQAHEMFKHLIYYGRKNLLFIEDIEDSLVVYPHFPQTLEENILQAIGQGDIQETDRALEVFIRDVLDNENLRQHCYLTFSRLLVDILRISQEYDLDQSQYVRKGDAFEQLFTLKNWRQIYNWFKKNYTDPLLVSINQRVSRKDAFLIAKMKKIAEARYGEYLSVEIVAAELSCSPSYLRRIFKGGTGTAFNTYLTNCRMHAAKNMLEKSALSIFEIAEKLTYQNSQNFIRTFKSHIGMTPGEYRKLKGDISYTDKEFG